MDYGPLNNLLPAVTKAHSKAKGALTLVPLPQFGKIYAQLSGLKIYSTFLYLLRSSGYCIALSAGSQKISDLGLAQAPVYFHC